MKRRAAEKGAGTEEGGRRRTATEGEEGVAAWATRRRSGRRMFPCAAASYQEPVRTFRA